MNTSDEPAREACGYENEQAASSFGWLNRRAQRSYCVHLVSGDQVDLWLHANDLVHVLEMLQRDRALIGRVNWMDDQPEHEVLVPAHRVLLITAEA